MIVSKSYVLKTIGVIGDVHAEASLLEIALAFVQNLQPQAILCVGDIVDGPGSVDRCCELLQQYRVMTVRGNRDRWFCANETRQLPEATLPNQLNQNSIEFIAGLPATRELETTVGKLLLCHGIGSNDIGRIMPDDVGYAIEANVDLQELVSSQKYRFMINGHTHRRMVRSFGSLTVINAGTLKQSHDPCFLLVDFDAKIAQFYNLSAKLVISKGEQYPLVGVKHD